MESQVQPGDDIDEFPEDIVQDVEGLTWLGHLEDTFEFCGHDFTIRTLKADEELQAALLVKEFSDSVGQAKAWAWANIALSLVAIDGDEDFCPPVGPDRGTHARAKFKWVTSRWYWPVGEYIFARYASLVQRQAAAVRAVSDLSSRSLNTSMSSSDFLSVLGLSPEGDQTLSNSDF
jgi:hypothetical protein